MTVPINIRNKQNAIFKSCKTLLLAAVLARSAYGFIPPSANILVVAGTNGLAQTAAGVLNSELTTAGNTVTVVNTGVPVSLSGYTQIYDVRYSDEPTFSSAERSQYLAFLNAAPGNTLFLMGENPGFSPRNTPISSFINLAGGGTIAPPAANSTASETVNTPFTGPNPISTVTFASCGLVTSAGTGAFAASEAGGGCAVYFGLGTMQNALQGALVVVYDVNFIVSAPTIPFGVNEVPFRLNLEQFASSPTTPPTISAVTPSSGPTAGGTQINIIGTGFTDPSGVTIGGVPATNVFVDSPSLILATTPPGVAGTASVVVSAATGANGSNALFMYVNNSVAPFQMFPANPVSLQVIRNQSLTVSGRATVVANQVGSSWQAKTTTPWLTLNNASDTFPSFVSMTANATGLDAGIYTGSITVTSGTQSISIPVTLTVLAPQSISVNPSVVSFASGFPAGGATGYDIQVGPAGVPFTAQASASTSSWLSISPASGVGPATIHVTTDPSKATPGTYQGSIVITSPGAPNSPMTIPVSLSVSNLFLTLPQQVHSATGSGPDHTVAPNEIVSLFLSDFSCPAQPVVSLNGTAVSWSSYTPGQINYAVPGSVTAPATLSVACNGNTAWTFNGLNVASTIPGVFTANSAGAGQAAAINADGTPNTPSNPADRGTYISVYVSGFGAFSTASTDGLRRLSANVTAQIGGLDTTVQYPGEAPGSTDGLQQINLQVPANSPVGSSVAVMLWVDGTPTQATATIAVK